MFSANSTSICHLFDTYIPAPVQEGPLHLLQVDKRAQVNLLKAAASPEETIGQHLNGPQWCEINELQVGASAQEALPNLP